MKEPLNPSGMNRRTLGFKLTLAFVLVISLPMALLAYISYTVTDSILVAKAKERMILGLEAAWREYYVRADQMRLGMLQAASEGDIKAMVAGRDARRLREVMARWKVNRPYVDAWAVVDAGGRVIARLTSDSSGDVFDPSGLVTSAIASRGAEMATVVLDAEHLRLEGAEVIRHLTKETFMPSGGGRTAAAPAEAMAVMVATPVIGASGEPLGAIITADVINIDNMVPDALTRRIPGLFASISLNGTRVSTNLVDSSGRVLMRTAIPEDVAGRLVPGARVYSEWAHDDGVEYLSLFEPILGFKGSVVGSIDVTMPKESLWVIQRTSQRAILIAAGVGFILAVSVAFVSARRITRPLNALKESLKAYAGGDRSARVAAAAGARDELGALGAAFNSMMETVSARDEEKARHLEEINAKNAELERLNADLKSKNEEIEIAYEETQSQTEELHAVNEELKLLNEDLDRKNAELKLANQTIKNEEDEIRRSKNKLRLIYDSIRDYLLVVDYDHRIVEANKAFIDAFVLTEPVAGLDIKEVLGAEACAGECPVRTAIDRMAPTSREAALPDGRTYSMHAFPIVEYDSPARMAVLYVSDVTERKLIMEKLAHTDKLSSIGELVSGVAHELNNPLTGIMCYAEILMEERLGDQVNGKLSKITDASMRCKKIIDNLLTFARWHKPEKRLADVNSAITAAVDIRDYQLKTDNVELRLNLDRSLPSAMIDTHQIQQVLVNLINNARDAIKDSGVGSGAITISSSMAGPRILVSVEDTGIGIPEGAAKKMFDPFYTTKGVGKGTGLGLSISYGIVKEHGGEIYASSRDGGGAVFTIELPVGAGNGAAAEARAMDPAETMSLAEAATGRSALILDDEPIVLDILQETLLSAGMRVDRTSTADEALKRVRERDYSVIISDIKMPGMDGKEFYRQVLAVNRTAAARIIFISGDSVSGDTRKFLADTGNIALRKPFSIADLGSAISKLISSGV